MPTFDITNTLDAEAFKNAIDSVNREISKRYDFKNSEAQILFKDNEYYILAESENKLNQIIDLLAKNIARKKINDKSISIGSSEKSSGNMLKKKINKIEGISKENAQEIIKIIKKEKFKAQAAIQGEQIRISGKKRDDLQNVIAKLKETHFKIPLNFVNFRD